MRDGDYGIASGTIVTSESDHRDHVECDFARSSTHFCIRQWNLRGSVQRGKNKQRLFSHSQHDACVRRLLEQHREVIVFCLLVTLAMKPLALTRFAALCSAARPVRRLRRRERALRWTTAQGQRVCRPLVARQDERHRWRSSRRHHRHERRRGRRLRFERASVRRVVRAALRARAVPARRGGSSGTAGKGGVGASGGSSGTAGKGGTGASGGSGGSVGKGGTAGAGTAGTGTAGTAGSAACTADTPCSEEGSQCSSGCCACNMECKGGTWTITSCAACVAPSCPPSLPVRGSACSVCGVPDGGCTWPDPSGAIVVGSCVDGQWDLTPESAPSCCAADTDCGSAQICVNRQCMSTPVGGCFREDQCGPNEICGGTLVCGCNGGCAVRDYAGVCVPANAGCCSSDGDCGGPCVAGVCKKPMPPGCWRDADCPTASFCVNAQVCPCGSMCASPDVEGTCRYPQ